LKLLWLSDFDKVTVGTGQTGVQHGLTKQSIGCISYTLSCILLRFFFTLSLPDATLMWRMLDIGFYSPPLHQNAENALSISPMRCIGLQGDTEKKTENRKYIIV